MGTPLAGFVIQWTATSLPGSCAPCNRWEITFSPRWMLVGCGSRGRGCGGAAPLAADHQEDHRGDGDQRDRAADPHDGHCRQRVDVGAGVERQAAQPDLVPEARVLALAGL